MTAETSNAREWVLVPRVPTAEMVQASDDISCRGEGAEHWAAMLDAAPPPAAARGEWVLVPRNPTEAMIDAWRDAPNIWEDAYAAMLAAAPLPPADAEARVYQCPRCATSMEVDPTAKPEARGVVDAKPVGTITRRDSGDEVIEHRIALDPGFEESLYRYPAGTVIHLYAEPAADVALAHVQAAAAALTESRNVR